MNYLHPCLPKQSVLRCHLNVSPQFQATISKRKGHFIFKEQDLLYSTLVCFPFISSISVWGIGFLFLHLSHAASYSHSNFLSLMWSNRKKIPMHEMLLNQSIDSEGGSKKTEFSIGAMRELLWGPWFFLDLTPNSSLQLKVKIL